MSKESQRYIATIGRRKRASSQVRIVAGGKGDIVINGKPLKEYFPIDILQREVLTPFEATGTAGKFDVSVLVQGGGVHGQATAVRHGIARGLIEHNPDFRAVLKKEGFLTRDARKKERKKYGKKSARRAPQWSKR